MAVIAHDGGKVARRGHDPAKRSRHAAPTSAVQARRDLVWAVTPFGQPITAAVVAAWRAGGLGVLDVGTDRTRAVAALTEIEAAGVDELAVRIGARARLGLEDLPDAVSTVVLAPSDPGGVDGRIAAAIAQWRNTKRVVVEVVSLAEALAAVDAGADGVVAKGAESGGRVGATGAFVLLQQLVAGLHVPVWGQGGIGLHTAAAAVAGGAAGVVLDTQLALTAEVAAELPAATRRALAAMDGGETVVLDAGPPGECGNRTGGLRVFTRPDLPVTRLVEDSLPPADRLGPDVRRHLVAAGNDTALAGSLAGRLRTVGPVVRAVARSIEEGVHGAAELRPLGPGAPLAAAHGLGVPVAQGPMTRVSDQPGFARAVAEAGGLPFLALALMEPDAAHRLLDETAATMDGLPWGVGILGFVPPDLRAAQMAVVRDVRPPVALIAGGRPAQSRPLEEAGIATFLHVPSPGLLRLFLREGARRFVFEGRECGGHIGPRPSFVLWEQQLAELYAAAEAGDLPGLDEIEVFFAGGVHDARSAAMVSAAAAGLAARGAGVGVLMGTAYLFTEESVAHGAVTPTFQAVSLACQATAVLETSPGHATRCAVTGFAEEFGAERRRLEAEGTPAADRWAALDALNLGRLRLAAKGLQRDGNAVVAVDEGHQRSHGLYMLGDVAALRHEVTTVAELHREVSEDSATVLAERSRALDAMAELDTLAAPAAPKESSARTRRLRAPDPPPLEVAIVGMAGIFPGAPDLGQFWANVLGGIDAITDVPPSRFDARLYGTAEGAGRRSPLLDAGRGGFLPPVPIDPLRWGLPPASLAAIEPVQLLALHVAAQALADAGYDERPFDRSRAAVIFGTEGATDLAAAYGVRALLPTYLGGMPAELDELLPALTEDSFPGVLSNVVAGRIANRLDLGGANYIVDAACASSLAAVHLACQELASFGADLVLCGASDLHNGPGDYQMFASVHALSPTGKSRPFDADADGIVLGEAVVCLALKRLADAERDGDRVYAVVRGVGASSDGRSLGLTAPRTEGQQRALHRAYGQARLSPADVGLVEAHGTGTTLGDLTELQTLTAVFAEAGAGRGAATLGSVKSQVGHTKCAAGLVGLAKSALALHHGIRPPTANLHRPQPGWDAATSPFTFASTPRPWPDEDRVAGVSAFGFGGSNFHVVLSSPPGAPLPPTSVRRWPAELVLVRGDDPADLPVSLAAVAGRCQAPGATLRQVAEECWRGSRQPVLAAVVATDLGDLEGKLAALTQGQRLSGTAVADRVPARPPKVAWLFPGQGSQRPGMLAGLFTTFPALQEVLRLGGRRLVDVVFPPAAFSDAEADAQRAALADTAVAQPGLGLVELALAQLLGELGLRPDAVAGHSYGELVALCVAGALTPASLVALSRVRAEAILAACGDEPGTMAAVALSADELRGLVAAMPVAGSPVVVANDNAPRQAVLSGSRTAVAEAARHLAERGFAVRPLPVACGFHRPELAPACERFAEVLATTAVHDSECPVWADRTAAPYPTDPDGVRAELAAQVAAPVRFREVVEHMHAAGVEVFIEVGPSTVLGGLVRRTLGGLGSDDRARGDQASGERAAGDRATGNGTPLVLGCDGDGADTVVQLLQMLGALAVAGVPLDLGRLFDGRPEPAAAGKTDREGWTVDGNLVRAPDGAVIPGGLRPADEVASRRPLAAASAAPVTAGAPVASPIAATHVPGPPVAGGEAVVLEYLRMLQALASAGNSVVSQLLGTPAETVASSALPPSAVPNGTHATVTSAPPLPGAAPMTSPADGKAVLHQAVDAEAVPAANGNGVTPPLAGTGPSTQRTAVMGRDELLALVVAVVGERTGYPAEMLEPTLDLEADLSIDSIKRIEIVGELIARLGMAGPGATADLDDRAVEELAKLKTLTAVVDWLVDALGGDTPDGSLVGPLPDDGAIGGTGTQPEDAAAAVATAPASTGARHGTYDANGRHEHSQPASPPAVPGAGGPEVAATAGHDPAGGVPPHATRFVPECMTLAPARGNAHRLDGKVVVVTDDERGIAGELVPLLEWCGAVAKVVDAGPLPAADVVVHLAGVRPGAPGHLPRAAAELAGLVATPLRDGLGQLLVLSGLGGRFGIGMPADGWPDALAGTGLGLRGLVKTVVQEHPGTITHLVDVDLGAGPVAVSRWLAAELVADDPVVEVGYDGDRRVGLRMVPDPLPQHGSPAEVAGPGHVALLTGGARGITSRVAIDLAVHGTVVELVGRTPMADEPEPPELALCPDTVALRQALAVGGGLDRSAIERRVAGVLAQRELRATAAALDAAGARWQYHVADVRDRDAVSAVVADVVGRHGTIDLVVHGAGVLEDRLLVDKTPESFERVWSTKVDGAANVLAALQALRTRPAAVVLFGSIAGAFGNRGQCDYAAANDALEAVARSATGKVAERVVCVHWGPWAASGMVSAGVADRFARRGICLVEPEDGLLHLARELALGPAAQAVVVVSRALPASLLGTTNTAANTARPPGGGSAGQNRRGASGRAPRP